MACLQTLTSRYAIWEALV